MVVLGPPPPISGGGQYEDSWDTHWTWEGRMAQMTWRGWARGQPDNATSELEEKRPGQGGRRVQPARRPRGGVSGVDEAWVSDARRQEAAAAVVAWRQAHGVI